MRTIYIILGSISLALGVLGIFLPLLPTTPFLLLTAGLYFKGSPRLYEWLLNNKYLGTYIHNYREHKSITLTTKIVALTLMWASILFCIYFVVTALWLKILLGAISAGVTVHILSFKTMKNGDGSDRGGKCDEGGESNGSREDSKNDIDDKSGESIKGVKNNVSNENGVSFKND